MLSHDPEDELSIVEVVKEQIISDKCETTLSSNASLDPTTLDQLKDENSQPVSLEASEVDNSMHPPVDYAPQQFYYGGYDIPIGQWDEYPQYVNTDAAEMTSAGVYHAGYGYNSQTPYGPYSPATTPVPPVLPDGPLYHSQQFPYTGFAPIGPPNVPYITSPIHVSQGDLSTPSSTNHQRGISDSFVSNGMQFGPGPGYSPPHGSLVGGSFSGNVGKAGYYDMNHGFDGYQSCGSWSNWSNSVDGTNRSLTSFMSSPVASQPVAALGPFGQNLASLSPGAVPHQQMPMYGSGLSTSSHNKIYGHGGLHGQDSNLERSAIGLGTNGRTWIAVDKGRRRANGTGSLCSCNGSVDILGGQNRGPRGTRPRSTDQVSPQADNKDGRLSLGADLEKHNRPDFLIEYEDAKFFIIKSYNEDNVHKSIKYGVWASTPNGNRKLDSAYRESKEKDGSCPVFLLFSVNASAQFCGVAEMVGPVDFDKSVDYWQQDKWSGQFPVTWHVVKDVPNSLFRHIILENNDNKPVTNSRDTQEVRLDQGLEILKIFKNYDSNVSILDDFDYYEERERAIQERKAIHHQASFVAPVATTGEDHTPPPAIPVELVKSFASVVRLGENRACGPEETDKVVAVSKTEPGK